MTKEKKHALEWLAGRAYTNVPRIKGPLGLQALHRSLSFAEAPMMTTRLPRSRRPDHVPELIVVAQAPEALPNGEMRFPAHFPQNSRKSATRSS